MMHGEMTDDEVAEQLARADRFTEELRNAISEAIASVDPNSLCADEQRRGLARIAATLDAVPVVTLCNLATVDEAMKMRIGFGLMQIVEAHLSAVGGGPSLDFVDANAFLAEFVEPIELARKRRAN